MSPLRQRTHLDHHRPPRASGDELRYLHISDLLALSAQRVLRCLSQRSNVSGVTGLGTASHAGRRCAACDVCHPPSPTTLETLPGPLRHHGQMIEDDIALDALKALSGPALQYLAAIDAVPREPGLYALYGDQRAWSELGLSASAGHHPLYVGKAEKSLNSRDVRTHFAAGKTGSSTVRRSLASLLRERLSLVPVPRNLVKPDGSANFALEATSESRLSDWMSQRLSLAIWTAPHGAVLDDVETVIVRHLRPPLNLDKVGEPRQRLRAARREMADLARAWRPGDERTQA